MMLSCTCTLDLQCFVACRNLKNGTSEIYKCIKPSKEERIQNLLHKPDGPMAYLMPSSAIDAANSTICEIFSYSQMALSINVEHTKRLFIVIARATIVWEKFMVRNISEKKIRGKKFSSMQAI